MVYVIQIIMEIRYDHNVVYVMIMNNQKLDMGWMCISFSFKRVDNVSMRYHTQLL